MPSNHWNGKSFLRRWFGPCHLPRKDHPDCYTAPSRLNDKPIRGPREMKTRDDYPLCQWAYYPVLRRHICNDIGNKWVVWANNSQMVDTLSGNTLLRKILQDVMGSRSELVSIDGSSTKFVHRSPVSYSPRNFFLCMYDSKMSYTSHLRSANVDCWRLLRSR